MYQQYIPEEFPIIFCEKYFLSETNLFPLIWTVQKNATVLSGVSVWLWAWNKIWEVNFFSLFPRVLWPRVTLISFYSVIMRANRQEGLKEKASMGASVQIFENS